MSDYTYNQDEDEDYMVIVDDTPNYDMLMFLIIFISIILGFVAVDKLCLDTSDRGKNIRLIMYVLLFLTGGQIAWLYILLWLLQINVCG